MISSSLAVLLLYGSVGMLLAAWLADPPAGPAFWRLTLLLIFAGAGAGVGMRLTGLTPQLVAPGPVAFAMLGLGGLALLAYGVRQATVAAPHDRWLLGIATLLATAGVLADPLLRSESLSGLDSIVFAVGLASIALALGSVLLAMVLAHWYLIEPRMPVGPLNRVLALFLGTEALKLVLLVPILAFHWPGWVDAPGGLLRSLVLGDGLFLAVRAVLGILAPLGLGWMTWKTVQIRSIQSATGILYAAIVFVLFGEVISLFLSISTGQPF